MYKKLVFIFAFLIFLVGYTNVRGQSSDVGLRGKRITIQMNKKPLFTVFARLTFKYDIAVGFEESDLDKDHTEYAFQTNVPYGKFLPQFEGDKEVRSADQPQPKDHLITADFKDARLEDVMDSIVSQMQNYDWEINNGVVNIFPTRGRNPVLKKLLDLKIGKFSVGKDTDVVVIRELLFDLPEFKRFLTANNLAVDFTRGDFWFDGRRLQADMDFSDLTFRDLLNAITASKRGGWILQKNKAKYSNPKKGVDIIDILI